MKTLTIRLTAPLQSYGNETSFNRRTTDRYPSKSAIIGMIAAALGYQRNDARINKLNELSFAVRIDQPGTIVKDFQTVEWAKGRKITYRDYLQDAVFMVAFGSDDEQLISEIKLALAHPQYALFLGRRANVPAGPLQVSEFEYEPVKVLADLEWQAALWYQRRCQNDAEISVGLIADATALATHSQMVKDYVKSFDPRHRQYGFRAITNTRIKVKNPSFVDTDKTEHDVMSAI